MRQSRPETYAAVQHAYSQSAAVPVQRLFCIKKAFGCHTESFQSSCKRCGGKTAVRICLWNHGLYSTNSASGQNDSSV